MKTLWLRRVNLLIYLAIPLLACHPRSSSPLERLDEAASTASAGDASPRQLALAGFHAFLVRSDFAKAQSGFDAALKKNPSEPYALFGQLLMTQRLAHPERALVAALELCQRAPTHPLAASAARYIFDVAGTSTALDDVILSRGQQALAAGLLPGDAAHLVRAAISVIQGYRGADSEQARTLAEMGTVDRFTIIGPFSAFHLLEFDQLTPPERNGSVAGPLTGPFGEIAGRIITCPDGRFNLANEGPVGDVYLLAVDLEVRDQDRYVVRAVSSSTHKTIILRHSQFTSAVKPGGLPTFASSPPRGPQPAGAARRQSNCGPLFPMHLILPKHSSRRQALRWRNSWRSAMGLAEIATARRN